MLRDCGNFTIYVTFLRAIVPTYHSKQVVESIWSKKNIVISDGNQKNIWRKKINTQLIGQLKKGLFEMNHVKHKRLSTLITLEYCK